MAGFVDYLTAVMTLLIVADVVICELIFLTLGKNFAKLKEDPETSERLKAFGSILLGLSLPMLVLGLDLDMTWPLPGSYNFIYGDMVIYIGTILLVTGLLMFRFPEQVRYVFPLIAVFSIFVIVYAIDILYYNLGQNPLAAAGMMALEGLGGIATSTYLFTSWKFMGYLAIALLAIAIVIIVITNVESIFDHTVTFKSWFP